MPSLPSLPPRKPDSHKGDYGRVLLVGGSRGMAGAIAVAGMAALRSGAGLVSIATPDVVVDLVASFHPCYMTLPLGSDGAGRIAGEAVESLLAAAARADCIAIGPGLGQSPDLGRCLQRLFLEVKCPMVVDADGLNGLRGERLQAHSPAGPRILTPHPGEWQRWCQVSATDRPAQIEAAVATAKRFGWTIVLKGHRSVVTDGERVEINQTGNAKMAVGGSGDCLTGIIAALVGQGLSPFDAARLGTHVHGQAGDLAATRLGCPSVLATDLIDALTDHRLWDSPSSEGS
jgi:ADP-dependent NAD(P)H-hydrate dehydratase